MTKATKMLPINQLVPYPKHPFKLYEGERLDNMVQSVRELGVLQPIIVRPMDKLENTYEILSGHNRVNAAKLAGRLEMPAIIKDGLDDEDAKLIVTETNLVQRSFADLSHSEKAIALKLHMAAITRQGKRTDLIDEVADFLSADETRELGTCDPPEHKLNSREQTALAYDLSPSSVARYVRVALLIRPLLDRVDNGEIAIRPAVAISYLPADEQEMLEKMLNKFSFTIDMKKADALRECSKNEMIAERTIFQILSGELDKKSTPTPKPKSPPPLKIKHEVYSKFFSKDTKLKEMEAIIEQALTEYFENQQKSKGEKSA